MTEPPATLGGPGRRRSFPVIWLSTFLVFVVVGVAWSLAQPVLSGADEPGHVIHAEAVWSGQIIPPISSEALTQGESSYPLVSVPANGSYCFLDAASPAGCDHLSLRGPTSQQRTPIYVGREPPLPLLLVGLPIAINPDRLGLYLSRFLVTAFAAGFLATSVALAVSRRRPFLLAGVVLAATPSAVAAFGVLGTSYLEIGAASLLWVSIALVIGDEPLSRRLIALTTFAALTLVVSRPISFVYFTLAGLALVVAEGPARLRAMTQVRAFRVGSAMSLLALLGALAWYRFAEAPFNPKYLVANHLPIIQSWSGRILTALGTAQNNTIQSIGSVGHNEYKGPWWVVLGWIALSAAVVGVGLLFATRRRTLAVAGLFVALLGLPIVSQSITLPNTSVYWQGRYDIPTLAGVLILAASTLDAHWGAVLQLRRLAISVVPLCALMQIGLYYGSFHRFAVGITGSLNPLRWEKGWRAPIPDVDLLVIGTTALVVAYTTLAFHQRTALSGPRQQS